MACKGLSLVYEEQGWGGTVWAVVVEGGRGGGTRRAKAVEVAAIHSTYIFNKPIVGYRVRGQLKVKPQSIP